MTASLARQASRWLTTRRVRVHGLLVAVCLWSVYVWDIATPGLRDHNGLLKGTDFLYFYIIGYIARVGHGSDLYDMNAQAALAHKLVPESAGIFYLPLYGPQVSLFFAPFARLPYACALTIWLLLNIFIYGLCCYAIWRTCAHLRSEASTVLLLAIACPALFHLIAWGQTSALALACLTLAFLALRSDRRFLAGLAIGLLIFKPQLGLVAASLFLFAREWKIVLGALLASLGELATGWLYYGTPVMRDYAHHLLHVREVLPLLEPKPYQMHSLRTFWSLLVPWPGLAFALYLITVVIALVLTLRLWRTTAPLSLRYSGLLLATVLVAPHLTIYDLVIVAPAFLLLADWVVGNPENRLSDELKILLYLSYTVPLLGPIARWTHVQLSVIALTAVLWLAWQLAQKNSTCRTET